MTEQRFITVDRWIKDNCIGTLLNIDFNTITDANLCCNLLNQIEKEKRNNGKFATKLLKENEQLKQQNKQYVMMVNANSDLNDEIYEQLQKTEKNYKFLLNENEELKQQLADVERLIDDLGHDEMRRQYKEIIGDVE